jgi:uncharacterized protein YPO0396
VVVVSPIKDRAWNMEWKGGAGGADPALALKVGKVEVETTLAYPSEAQANPFLERLTKRFNETQNQIMILKRDLREAETRLSVLNEVLNDAKGIS